MSDAIDKKIIVCNFATPRKTASEGTRAYFASNSGGTIDGGNVNLLYRSRGGRTIVKYERLKHLKDFRLATLPPDHPLYNDERVFKADEEWASKTLEHVRYWNAASRRSD